MGRRFKECEFCVHRCQENIYNACYFCKRDYVNNDGKPTNFRPEQKVRYSDCAENRKPVMVPVMFDEFALQGIHHKCYKQLDIENVIFNDPATIVLWNDGTKTVVKAAEGDEFDPEKGMAMAISKKIFGNQGSYYNKIKKWTEKYEEPLSAIERMAVALDKLREKERTVMKKHAEDRIRFVKELRKDKKEDK